VLLRDNYQCRLCGAVVHGKRAHVDHIVPKAKGGSDEVSNLRCLCVSCHSRHEGWRSANQEKNQKTLG
jgi:5-methylcytosine-specific restriction endonuclease McrA